MPFALIVTDIKKDQILDQYIYPTLQSLGFEYQIISPATRCFESIRMLSLANGRIDILLLLHTGAISSETSNPLNLIRTIRSFDDKYAFQESVKVKSLPILAIIDISQAITYELNDVNFSLLNIFDPIRIEENLEDVIIDLLRRWRADLLSELECVGYSITINLNGELSVDPTFKRSDVEGEIIACSSSIDKLRKSKYVILSKDLVTELKPYQELQFLLNNYKKYCQK